MDLDLYITQLERSTRTKFSLKHAYKLLNLFLEIFGLDYPPPQQINDSLGININDSNGGDVTKSIA